MMSEEKKRIESCMVINGYKGSVVSFDRSLVDEYVFHICWSDGKEYIINVDRFTVDEIGVDNVGED